MDRITSSLLTEFATEYGLGHLPEDKRFERFCAYLFASRHLGENPDPESLATGGGADTGIDGLAIIVNGSLITDVDQLNDLAENASYLEVTFVFVQADRAESFTASKTGSFGFGVKDFFSETPSLSRNDAITDAS